jgi:hypothetical protein
MLLGAAAVVCEEDEARSVKTKIGSWSFVQRDHQNMTATHLSATTAKKLR